MPLDIIFAALFVISGVFNTILLYSSKKYKSQLDIKNDELEALKKAAPGSDAQRMLAQIAGGNAILRISMIDPGDIFIKSPRG